MTNSPEARWLTESSPQTCASGDQGGVEGGAGGGSEGGSGGGGGSSNMDTGDSNGGDDNDDDDDDDGNGYHYSTRFTRTHFHKLKAVLSNPGNELLFMQRTTVH